MHEVQSSLIAHNNFILRKLVIYYNCRNPLRFQIKASKIVGSMMINRLLSCPNIQVRYVKPNWTQTILCCVKLSWRTPSITGHYKTGDLPKW